ncbi:MAG: hypothetical protein KF826_11360 [Xanthobacteraceae bacterium]|nr:hypothetical protein [Xanthobacteraceae bacterium]MCW5676866.1 hypothetical protein [Xanthobacteraceae bacterium]
MFEVRSEDGVAILTLARGKANALDVEFCKALKKEFRRLAKSDSRAVILTSEGKIFSAGSICRAPLRAGESISAIWCLRSTRCTRKFSTFRNRWWRPSTATRLRAVVCSLAARITAYLPKTRAAWASRSFWSACRFRRSRSRCCAPRPRTCIFRNSPRAVRHSIPEARFSTALPTKR